MHFIAANAAKRSTGTQSIDIIVSIIADSKYRFDRIDKLSHLQHVKNSDIASRFGHDPKRSNGSYFQKTI